MSTVNRLRLLLVPFVVVLGAVAGGAAASPPTPASGTVVVTSSTFDSVRPSGPNLIVELHATAVYTGTFSGTSTFEGTLIIRADGSANFHDVETFTGTVNGVRGTVTFDLAGSNDSTLSIHATATIIDSSGDLAGLHGVLHEVGTVVFPTGPASTYTGTVG